MLTEEEEEEERKRNRTHPFLNGCVKIKIFPVSFILYVALSHQKKKKKKKKKKRRGPERRQRMRL